MVDLSKIKVRHSNRRTVALHLLADGSIEVRAPHFMPKFIIDGFVRKHSEWIEKRMGLVTKKSPNRTYEDGQPLLYLGQEYPMKIGNYTKIEIKNGEFHFPQALVFRAKVEIERWYKAQAKEFITGQLDHYAKEMNTSYSSVYYSDTSSKWGSCTRDNKLQFNYRLILAPLLVLRYVIIHELAHTLEKNHSHKFWSRVAVFNPSYKQQIKWLRLNGDALVI